MDLLSQLRAAVPSEYVIEDYLNKGGQGTVFTALLSGKKVALKVFAPSSDLRRVQREVELLTNIASPNLVKIQSYTVVNIEGAAHPIIAYEYLAGGDLTDLLKSDAAALSAHQLAEIGRDIGRAVDRLWSLRISHRDIKPGNIVRAQDGRYVLVDLGLARHLDRSNITAPGMTAGTPGYMSPEQARGRRDLTVRSDIFSLGVTLYELAYKRHPFGRDQFRIGMVPVPPLHIVRTDIPQPLGEFVNQMMATRPLERPITVTTRFEALLGA